MSIAPPSPVPSMTREVQVSLKDAFAKFLTEEKFMDVVLQGKDGEQVPANRCILASRSEVFRQMLFGSFKEASLAENVISIGYDGNILRAVVEYICTDSAEIFHKTEQPNESGADSTVRCGDDETLMGMFVCVADAASYFHLPGLSHKVEEIASKFAQRRPPLAFVLLQACLEKGPSIPPTFQEKVVSIIRSEEAADAVENACDDDNTLIASLSADTLEYILQDPKMEWQEYQLYQLVSMWVYGPKDDPEVGQLRVQTARDRLVQHIRFESIHPEYLTTDIATSGFVEDTQLYEAFKIQALAAANSDDFKLKLKKPRYVEWTEEPPINIDDIVAIKVEGAGLANANGVYIHNGVFGGPAQFGWDETISSLGTLNRNIGSFVSPATRTTSGLVAIGVANWMTPLTFLRRLGGRHIILIQMFTTHLPGCSTSLMNRGSAEGRT